MLLNISNKYIYEKDIETGKRSIRFIRPEEHNESGEAIHYPHFLIVAQDGQDINELLNTIQERIQREGNDFYSPYSNIVCDEDSMPYHTIQEKRSYIDPYTNYVTASICVLPSYKVPAVSTALFKDYGIYSAEFDVPYRDRAFIDLGATDQRWILDTEGKEAEIDLLCYDIEAMEYDATREFDDDDAEKEYLKDTRIDMIGWAMTKFKYRAEHDLDTEDFDFEMIDIPDWRDPEVNQVVASTEVEEMEMLETFILQVMKADMIAGHNVMSYDNMHVYYRIQHFLEEQIPARIRHNFETFSKKYCEPSRVWISQWGKMLQTVNFYPFTFDTLPAAMKAYFFLDRHNLKFMAQYLGIKIPDRIYLTQYEMTQAWESGENLQRFAKYNEHDVREQLGVTLSLLTNSLSVCHTTNLPADISMPSGTTNIWDIAAHMRAFREGIIFPPKLKYIEVAKWLVHNITERDKIDIAETIRRMLNQRHDVDNGVIKLIKYGNEMNDLALFPHIMYNAYAMDEVSDIINGRDAMTKYCNCPTCRRIKEALPENFNPDNAEHKEIYENWLRERFERESEGPMDSKHSIREDEKGYHFPGGMTIKPQDQSSEYKLWYETKVADVGAMYPSNVKAEEIGGDTSRFVKPRYYKLDFKSMADPDEFDPTLSYQYIQRKDLEDFEFRDELLRWVWFKRLPDDFVQAKALGIYYKDLNNDPKYRNLKKMYPFVDRGYLIAVAIDQEKGCVASALTGIMKVIQKIKVDMLEMEESGAGSKEDIKKLEKIKMMYQSMKGMRNSASVDASRRMLVIDDNEQYRRIQFDDMFDMFDAPVTNEIKNDIKFEIKNISKFNYKTISSDKKGNIKITPIKNIIRHKYDGPMCRIMTKGGYSIITPNHSIFDIENDNLNPVECAQAKNAVSINKIPNLEVGETYINLLDNMPDKFYVYIDLNKDWSDRTKKILKKNIYSRKYKYSPYNRDKNYIKFKLFDISKRIKDLSLDELKMLEIGTSRDGVKVDRKETSDAKASTRSADRPRPTGDTNGRKNARIPAVIKIDEDIADFLGFYAAEGHISIKYGKNIDTMKFGTGEYHYIQVCSSQQDLISHYANIIRDKFNIKPYILNRVDSHGVISISMHAQGLTWLLNKIGIGHNAPTKDVPDIILNAKTHIKQAFIEGYIRGDGNVTERSSYPPNTMIKTSDMRLDNMPQYRFTSVSEDLAMGVRLLMSQLGIASSIGYRERRARNQFNVRKTERFYESVDINDAISAKIKMLDIVSPTSPYVYDIEVDDKCHNFLDHSLLLLKNTHGILSAPTVSCRQTNLWGAARITTLGQQCLEDALKEMNDRNIRVIYGDSVDASRDIIVKMNKRIDIINIKDLFNIMTTYNTKNDNHEYGYAPEKNITILSVDKQGNAEWKPLKFVKRHPYNDKILYLKTTRGDIKVTRSHSLYTLKQGTICPTYAKKLDIGDEICHVSYKTDMLNTNVTYKYNIFEPKVVDTYMTRAMKHMWVYGLNDNPKKGTPFIKAKEMYENGKISNIIMDDLTFKIKNAKNKIPVMIPLNKKLAAIIGHYIAEGSCSMHIYDNNIARYDLVFFNSNDPKIYNLLTEYIEEVFNRKCHIYTSSKKGDNGATKDIKRVSGGMDMCYLFYSVFGIQQHSNHKNIPIEILNSGKDIKRSLLEWYLKGDGSNAKFHKNSSYINDKRTFTTRSQKLCEGISILTESIEDNFIGSYRYRKEKQSYRKHIDITYYKNQESQNESKTYEYTYKRQDLNITDIINAPILEKSEIYPTDGFVYDICVDDNHNFVDAMGGILAHNTDGIYLACSRTAHTNPRMSKALGIEPKEEAVEYLTHPKTIKNVIEKLNEKWQKILDYPKFELEIEEHDATFYIKHKNYLMFDIKEDENNELSIHMGIKGANLKARDKPTFARKFLKLLMKKYLNKHIDWTDRTEEEETSQSIKDIQSLTRDTLEDVNVKDEDIKNLLLIQGVRPIHEYKVLKRKCSICKGTNMMTDCCKCGTKDLGDTFICEQCGKSEPELVECLYCAYGRQYHYYGKRANSLQHVLGHKIDSSIKLGLLVCNKPMPYYARPKKSPSKPLPYMWPKDKVEQKDIDYDWYKTMILHYIKGGFGFSDWDIDIYEIVEREKYVDVTLIPRYFMHIRRSDRKTSDRIEVDVALFSKYEKGDKLIGYQLPL